MPKTLKKNIEPIGQAKIRAIETSRLGEDRHSLNEQKKPDGLTLKRAAVIYFGGLSLLILGLLVVGFAT